MTSEEIIKEMAALPADAKREVEDLVKSHRKRYSSDKVAESGSFNGLDAEGFIGMWSHRDEMNDSTAWVRSIREKHWAK